MTFTLLEENIVTHPDRQARTRDDARGYGQTTMHSTVLRPRLTSYGGPPIDRRRKVASGEQVAEYSRRKLDAVALAKGRRTGKSLGSISNTPACKRDGNST
jgi:hypothetical protein